MADAKALADISQAYSTLQGGDLLFTERAGVAGKTTWAQMQTQNWTFSGTTTVTGATTLSGTTALSGTTTVTGAIDFQAGVDLGGVTVTGNATFSANQAIVETCLSGRLAGPRLITVLPRPG